MAKRRRTRGKSTPAKSRRRSSRQRAKAARKRPRKSVRASSRTRSAKPKRRKRRRSVSSRQKIDVIFKGLAVALEPPRDNDPANLDALFRARLEAALEDLSAQAHPFKFVEGFRTVERQQWLFGSGRPNVVPFGRAGKIVTQRDGVTKLSNHQGSGVAGTGKAADCYPIIDGRVQIPQASDPIWRTYAETVMKQGLVAGLNFPTLRDAPHCELV